MRPKKYFELGRFDKEPSYKVGDKINSDSTYSYNEMIDDGYGWSTAEPPNRWANEFTVDENNIVVDVISTTLYHISLNSYLITK